MGAKSPAGRTCKRPLPERLGAVADDLIGSKAGGGGPAVLSGSLAVSQPASHQTRLGSQRRPARHPDWVARKQNSPFCSLYWEPGMMYMLGVGAVPSRKRRYLSARMSIRQLCRNTVVP